MPQVAWETMLADALHPQGFRPRNSSAPKTPSMSSDACGRPSRRREEKEGACWTSPQAEPHAQIPPRHPATADAQRPAARTAPWEPVVPHRMTRVTPLASGATTKPKGGILPGSRSGRTLTTLPATPTARTPSQAEPTTANRPAGRAAQGPTQPDNPPNVTPYRDPSLPATRPATARERHAEPRPEKAKNTGSQWTPTHMPTGNPTRHGAGPKPAAVKAA